MREIKFRAYNKIEKKMMGAYSLLYIALDMCDWTWITNNDVIFMQYTGLKDKNGKMIFEGDILKIHKIWNGKKLARPYIGKVEFINGCYKLVDDINKDITELEYFTNGCKEYDIEVIGNIYENKELLNPKE